MPDPSTDLQSKINRAVRAVLVDQQAATNDNCYCDPETAGRTLPNTTVTTGDGVPFDGPGNWHFPVVNLNLRDDASVQPNQRAADQKTSANTRCTKIYNALARSDDTHTLAYTASELTRLGRALAVDASNGSDPVQAQAARDNADMADFTVLWWEFSGQGVPTKPEGSTFWERDLQFSCVACNAVL